MNIFIKCHMHFWNAFKHFWTYGTFLYILQIFFKIPRTFFWVAGIFVWSVTLHSHLHLYLCYCFVYPVAYIYLFLVWKAIVHSFPKNWNDLSHLLRYPFKCYFEIPLLAISGAPHAPFLSPLEHSVGFSTW